MFSPTADPRSTLDAIAEEAQRGLKERPSVSIRTRLSIAFLLWFILSLAITLVSILTTSRIQDTLHFLEAASRYSFEIQQAYLTPITPQKGYRDEFSQLAMAMNHMMVQLVRRHEMLTQAHKLKAVTILADP